MNLRSIINKVRSLLFDKKDALSTLRAMPRYVPGKFSLLGKVIEFPDGPSLAAMCKDIFERQIYKFNSAKDSPLIIDCGANIGISIIYFKSLYPGSRIIAFEPDPAIFKYLSNNVIASNLTLMTLRDTGVWSEDNEIEFEIEGADAGRVIKNKDDETSNKVKKVKVEKLSKYLTEEVDLLKIDIEGAEVEVIKEIEPQLKYINNLFIEYHSFVDRSQELDLILGILTKNNFRYYIESPFALREQPLIDRTSYHSMDGFLNIFASK